MGHLFQKAGNIRDLAPKRRLIDMVFCHVAHLQNLWGFVWGFMVVLLGIAAARGIKLLQMPARHPKAKEYLHAALLK
jgi:hypothetical protein